MQKTIELLKKRGELKVIDTPCDIYLEIPHLAYIEVKKPNSKALLFTKPIDSRNNTIFDTPVLINLFGSFSRVKLLIGDTNKIAMELRSFLKPEPPRSLKDKFKTLLKILPLRNIPPKILNKIGECQQVIKLQDEVNLLELPILTTWEEDGGAFITMGQVYTQSLDGKIKNLGMYRLQVFDKNHLGLHWQIHKDSTHFFEEYKRANLPMPVSIAIGGDPLYTWCATAPMPYGVFELLLYGFIKKKRAKMVRSITNPIAIPYDSDYVIEGFVNPNELRDEGRFGDHTGFYTPIEPYPVLNVTAITSKQKPTFLATVVGKPPLEDKYLGYPTERIFLPLLQTTTPDLIDYYMPENGVFHNLILAKINPHYPAAAKQSMHAFWGVGQMSFVKHAIFVNKDAPDLKSLDIIPYILERFSPQNCLLSYGICDALDHSSPNFAQGGKLGIDATDQSNIPKPKTITEIKLQQKLKNLLPEMAHFKQFYVESRNPITLIAVNKNRSLKNTLESFRELEEYLRIVILLDDASNDLENPYMIIWRVVNNIDALRDVCLLDKMLIIDATNKNELDGYTREWPKETDCNVEVLKNLRNKGLLEDFSEEEFLEFCRKYHIDKSYSTQ